MDEIDKDFFEFTMMNNKSYPTVAEMKLRQETYRSNYQHVKELN